jgi:hypothetical protein
MKNEQDSSVEENGGKRRLEISSLPNSGDENLGRMVARIKLQVKIVTE